MSGRASKDVGKPPDPAILQTVEYSLPQIILSVKLFDAHNMCDQAAYYAHLSGYEDMEKRLRKAMKVFSNMQEEIKV